jgi:hypothetical protein
MHALCFLSHTPPACRHTFCTPPTSQWWLTWPFLAWGVLIILAYAIGYVLLGTVAGPVALFNCVNYVNVGARALCQSWKA